MDKPQILLVDDVNLSLEMGKVALSDSDATIITACNGREALEVVKNDHPDLVLSDVYMPEMNGDELCNTIKTDPSLKDVPVILFSSYDDGEGAMDKHLRAGCDDLLVKPYKRQELINMVKKYVNVSSRGYQRAAVSINVEYLSNGETMTGTVVDMSIGGMLVESKKVFPIDSRVTFIVFINAYDNGTPAMGRIVWSDEQRMGIQFLFTPENIKSFLDKAA